MIKRDYCEGLARELIEAGEGLRRKCEDGNYAENLELTLEALSELEEMVIGSWFTIAKMGEHADLQTDIIESLEAEVTDLTVTETVH